MAGLAHQSIAGAAPGLSSNVVIGVRLIVTVSLGNRDRALIACVQATARLVRQSMLQQLRAMQTNGRARTCGVNVAARLAERACNQAAVQSVRPVRPLCGIVC